MQEQKKTNFQNVMRVRKDSLIPEKIKKEMNAAAKMKLFEVIKCPKPVHKFDFSGL